jgi:2-dehydropantoate 2-reductase
MKVVLFGTGAMACLFGARLASAADVTLVGTWAEAIAAIRERGILVEDSQGTRSVRVHAQSSDAPPVPADLVLVMVKAWQTRSIASLFPKYLNSEGLAVSLQNGLGNIEILGDRAFPGSTTEGATLLGPGHVKAGGSGQTYAVAPGRVIQLLLQAGFESHSCSRTDAEGLLWGKLCVSCGISALTATLRILNGELLEKPEVSDLMVRAAEECAAIARAKGIQLPFSNAAAQVKEVARRTARNKSSMYQDVLRGAPTECDAIYGSVVREAGLQGLDVPVNDIFWKTMHAAKVPQNRSDLLECWLRIPCRN